MWIKSRYVRNVWIVSYTIESVLSFLCDETSLFNSQVIHGVGVDSYFLFDEYNAWINFIDLN